MRKFLLTAAAVAAIATASEAGATVTINVLQSGSVVTATGSGTLDLAGMTRAAAPSYALPYFEADRAALFTGAAVAGQIAVYTGFTSTPASFGWGSTQSPPLSINGSFFGITNSLMGTGASALVLLDCFASGGSIQFTDQWFGQTFATLGLATGSYTYKLPSDRVVINIGATAVAAGTAAAVPEPATWGMMIVGLGMMGYAMRRRRAAIAATIAA